MSSYLLQHEIIRQITRPRTIICEICEAREAYYTCDICGRKTCEKCYDKDKKLCIVCLDTICDECGQKVSIDTCVICGKKICRECSVELDYARRICLSCHLKIEDPRQYIENNTRLMLSKLRTLWQNLKASSR